METGKRADQISEYKRLQLIKISSDLDFRRKTSKGGKEQKRRKIREMEKRSEEKRNSKNEGSILQRERLTGREERGGSLAHSRVSVNKH